MWNGRASRGRSLRNQAPRNRNAARTCGSFRGLWIVFGLGTFWIHVSGRGPPMVQLLAIAFFAGLFVGLAVLLQMTVRQNWADMSAAFMGRPSAGRRGRRACHPACPGPPVGARGPPPRAGPGLGPAFADAARRRLTFA